MVTKIVSFDHWECTRDSESHRTYKIRWKILADIGDGPATVLQTPDLPEQGATWNFGNDVDVWAFCLWDAHVVQIVDGEPGTWWTVEQTFTTKPPDNKTCRDQQITNPLLEPPKISGSFVKYTEEATKNVDGSPITTSSHEQIRGPQVEFDNSRPQVKIEMNVANLEYDLLFSMRDTVNDAPLWGQDPRCIKLSDISWERKFQGQCQVYYTRSLTFDINPDSFDRAVLDEGNKVLNGHWDTTTGQWILNNVAGKPPDESNPSHFVRFRDLNGEFTTVILDGHGKPYMPVDRGLPDTVTPGTACGSAPEIKLNKTYENITLPSRSSQFFKIKGSNTRRVVITVKTDGIPPSSIKVKFFNDDCNPLDSVDTVEEDNTYTSRASIDEGVSFPYLIAQVESLYDFGDIEYTIRISGTNEDDPPGQILVQYYKDSNFLLLGIPILF
jgi:hypothetical protein